MKSTLSIALTALTLGMTQAMAAGAESGSQAMHSDTGFPTSTSPASSEGPGMSMPMM